MSANDQNIAEINKFISTLKGKFTPNRTLMLAIAGHMHASVMDNFHSQGANIPGGWKKKMFPGKALIKSGGLIRSIQMAAKENESIVSTNYPGARLQNDGGEIVAKKKLGSVKRKKDVWAMEQYFWAMWYKSRKKEKLFMILALHMQKHNSILVPARPFMVLTDPFKDLIISEIRSHVAA